MAAKHKPPPPAEEQFPYDRCSIASGANRQCYFPATIYPIAAKRGTGTCRLHDGAWGQAVEESIAESERWYDARRRGEDVPLTYTRHDGRKVPGFPNEAQRIRQHADSLKVAAALQRGVRKPGNQRLPLPRLSREPGEDIEEEHHDRAAN